MIVAPSSQVALLVQLRIFQGVGRFLPMKDVPASGIEYAVCAHLTAKQGCALEALLKVDSQTQGSPFAQLCRAPGRASRKNLKALIERHQWLQNLPDPTAALQALADSKVLQWANEAKRLKAPELRRYVKPRRHALLLAVIRQARGQVLDDLTLMLLKLVGKIESKSGPSPGVVRDSPP
jgi:hypothetical protein